MFLKQERLGLQEEVIGGGSPHTNLSSHGSLSPRDLQRSPQSRRLSPTAQDSPSVRYMDNIERNSSKELNKYSVVKMESDNDNEALDMQMKSSRSGALDMSNDHERKQADEGFMEDDFESGRKVSYRERKANSDMEETIQRELSLQLEDDDEERRAQIAETARELELLRKASNGVSPHSPRDSQLEHFSANQEPYSRLMHASSVTAVPHSVSS